MQAALAELFDRQHGVATTGQILAVVTRHQLDMLVDCAALERIWRGVYSRGGADPDRRLRGLDLACGELVTVCLGTAARAFGFDTENTTDLHVLNPTGHQLRDADGLIVHRRDGAPLIHVVRPAGHRRGLDCG